MKKNELAHYGVLGMKWGVRKEKKYRKALNAINRDLESFKKAGEKKSGLGKDYKKTIKWFEEEKARRQDKLNNQIKANKKYKKAYRAQILSNPTKLYLNRKKFSEDEINKAMKKFSKEKTLRDYSRDSFSYGNDMAKKVKGYVLTAAATYAFAKKGAPLVKKLLGKIKGGK